MELLYIYTSRKVNIINDLRTYTWLLGTTSSDIYQDIMGCFSWMFTGISTNTGRVITLYYEYASLVSEGDR